MNAGLLYPNITKIKITVCFTRGLFGQVFRIAFGFVRRLGSFMIALTVGNFKGIILWRIFHFLLIAWLLHPECPHTFNFVNSVQIFSKPLLRPNCSWLPLVTAEPSRVKVFES